MIADGVPPGASVTVFELGQSPRSRLGGQRVQVGGFRVTLNPRHFPEEYAGVSTVTPGDLVALVRRNLLGLRRL